MSVNVDEVSEGDDGGSSVPFQSPQCASDGSPLNERIAPSDQNSGSTKTWFIPQSTHTSRVRQSRNLRQPSVPAVDFSAIPVPKKSPRWTIPPSHPSSAKSSLGPKQKIFVNSLKDAIVKKHPTPEKYSSTSSGHGTKDTAYLNKMSKFQHLLGELQVKQAALMGAYDNLRIHRKELLDEGRDPGPLHLSVQLFQARSGWQRALLRGGAGEGAEEASGRAPSSPSTPCVTPTPPPAAFNSEVLYENTVLTHWDWDQMEYVKLKEGYGEHIQQLQEIIARWERDYLQLGNEKNCLENRIDEMEKQMMEKERVTKALVKQEKALQRELYDRSSHCALLESRVQRAAQREALLEDSARAMLDIVQAKELHARDSFKLPEDMMLNVATKKSLEEWHNVKQEGFILPSEVQNISQINIMLTKKITARDNILVIQEARIQELHSQLKACEDRIEIYEKEMKAPSLYHISGDNHSDCTEEAKHQDYTDIQNKVTLLIALSEKQHRIQELLLLTGLLLQQDERHQRRRLNYEGTIGRLQHQLSSDRSKKFLFF